MSSAPALSLVATFVDNRAQLRRLAQSIVRNAETADDILQDAWLRLADGERIREVQRPVSYCCQVVRNLALDHCRRQALEATYRTYDIEVESLEVPAAATPHKTLCNLGVLQAIECALSKLPERTRRVHELYRIQGLTQRQIAEHMGCALGLVNGLLADAARAIESCRHLMHED